MVHALMPLPGALSACPVPKENIVPLHCLLAVLPHSIGLVRTLCVAGIASAAVLLVAFAREEPDVAPPTFAATWNGVGRATPAELESRTGLRFADEAIELTVAGGGVQQAGDGKVADHVGACPRTPRPCSPLQFPRMP